MTIAQVILVLIILIIVVVFILLYKGRYKPPKYPQFGR
jgi:uncharacterized membrane protein